MLFSPLFSQHYQQTVGIKKDTMDYPKAPPPPYSVNPPMAAPYQPPPPGFYVGPMGPAGPMPGAGPVPLIKPEEVAVVEVAPRFFGPNSQRVVCPHCHEHMSTVVKSEPSSKTHLFALLLLCVFWPCMCLPYCVDSCQNQNHYCSNCNAYLGSYDS